MFKIQGKILVKETGIGIPGLVVHAYDRDTPQPTKQKLSAELLFDRQGGADCLGSVITSQDGSFSILFVQEDFNISSGTDIRPEIYLVVSRPEDEDEKPASLVEIMLYYTRPARLKAGRTESFLIRIQQQTLDKFGILYPAANFPLLPLNPASATSFLNQLNLRASVKKTINQGLRSIQNDIDTKVDADFSLFHLSSFSPEIRNSINYLRPGDSLIEKQTTIIEGTLRNLYTAGSNKSMRLSFTEAQLAEMGMWSGGMPIAGTIPVSMVTQYFRQNSLQRQAFEPCVTTFSETDLNPDPIDPELPEKEEIETFAIKSIHEEIAKQLSTATSPETALKYNKVVDQNYKNDKICETVNLFSLCGGPADVTSYHDFHSVQIAFEHVWTELFDKDINRLSRSLYSEVVRIEEGYEETRSESFSAPSTSRFTIPGYGFVPDREVLIPSYEIATRTVSTVDDLSQLLKELAPSSASNAYLNDLINQLQQRLSEAYKFTVFAPDSINYGVVFTFRQKWEPVNYQVGKLVSSLPLAPKEVRKYSSKRVITKSKNEKYLDDREFKGKSESTSTSRAESEIIKRATNNTSFGVNTHASVDMEMFDAGIDTSMTNTSEKFSQDTKKNFREAVLNAVEEYRKQNKTEVEFGWKDEITTESSGEISNPNDEITVTYLFYELQRQYDISEELHKIQPVILVANKVPTPDEIDNDWLMANAWILKRVILDESFIPTINQLTASSIGDNLAINNLQMVLTKQQTIVDGYNAQVEAKTNILKELYDRIKGIAEAPDAEDSVLDQFNIARSIFDPIGSMLSGGAGALSGDTGPSRAERINEYLQTTIERTEKENKELASQLLREQNSLLQITEKYNKEIQDYFDRQTAIMQLRIHIKENVLYYMQAIWDYEPTDQRYFRLYNLEIDWFDLDSTATTFPVTSVSDRLRPSMLPDSVYEMNLPLIPSIRAHSASKRKLVEVANLDKLLGYKGNYMIFPVIENSYLHEFMIQEFIDHTTGGIKDADDFANYKTQDLIDYLKCVRQHSPAAFEREKNRVIALINERLQSPRKEKERIIIPTDSLFIEALPGKHPVMEDFKLAHRALDVKKVQANVRHIELENLRLAARLLEGEREDPDIEKVVINK